MVDFMWVDMISSERKVQLHLSQPKLLVLCLKIGLDRWVSLMPERKYSRQPGIT